MRKLFNLHFLVERRDVVTDPKGGLVNETGAFLLRKNYRVKIFNTINFKKSMHYNPFAYARHEVA